MQKTAKNNQAEALKILLNRLNAKFTSHSINSLKAHPEYPSLLSFNHVLNQLKIENAAVRVSYEQLHELPKPLVIHKLDNGGMFSVVDSLDEEKILFVNEKGKLEAQPKADFLKSWSGVAMLVDEEARGKEENYATNKVKDILHKVKLPFAVFSLLLAIIYPLNYYHSVFSGLDYLFLLTKALGVAVSIPLLMHLVDKNNHFVKKLCTSNNQKSKRNAAQANCVNVLDAPAATIFGVFAWSEIGFLYFTTLFFYLPFFPQAHSMAVIAGLAVLAAPYMVYSVYYQWKVARQWCRLCLAVQVVLLVELILAIAFFSTSPVNFTYQGMFALILVCSVILAAYSVLKPVIIEWESYKKQVPGLNKIKFNQDVFRFLLQKNNTPMDTAGIASVQLGNPEGKHKLTIISNPMCGPCIEMHRKLFQMLKNKENVRVEEVFLTDKKPDSQGYRIAKSMLQLHQTVDADRVMSAITAYYDGGTQNTEEWLQKYEQSNANKIEAQQILEQHINWCRDNKISATPTLLYNNYELPKEYSIKDLDYLID